MNLEKIRKALEKTGKVVFSINEIEKHGKLSPNVAKVYINRMAKKGLLKKIARNKYTISEDIFETASQLFDNSYISFTSGLYLHKIIEQVPSKITVVCPKSSRIRVDWLKIVKFKPEKIFGFRKIKAGKSFIAIGELEKIVADIAYKPQYSRLKYAFETIEKCNIKKLEKYSKKMSIATRKRIGYMLELKGKKSSLYKGLKGVHKLNPKNKELGKFNKKWKLYINEVLR